MQWFVPQLGRSHKLNHGDRYLINPGSVGNPRTPSNKPDNRAQYLIFDDTAMSVTFYRIKYDIKACIAAIQDAAEEMVARIEQGY
jgi:diadenosine tetraphosphatase ApaH/serine/threonine PP2A family protein phosphatase